MCRDAVLAQIVVCKNTFLLQAASSESLAAKEALIQHVLDVTGAERPPRHAPALQRAWLQSKCALSVHQLARADALYALSSGDNSARGKALLNAQQDSDVAAFTQTIAGPQHFSWKNSAIFGSWLVDCPAQDHPEVELIYVRHPWMYFTLCSSSMANRAAIDSTILDIGICFSREVSWIISAIAQSWCSTAAALKCHPEELPHERFCKRLDVCRHF